MKLLHKIEQLVEHIELIHGMTIYESVCIWQMNRNLKNKENK